MRVAGYEVTGEVGKGGMGRVLRVRHLATGFERALKVLDGVSGPEAVARFRREAEALAKASAAGAVPIHESGIERGALWYVMDLMTGGSLRDRLAKAGRLPWEEASSLVARIARIVDRCHAIGLVHRDLKPENVLFDDSGAPRLADFGCVRDAGQRSLTEAGELLGTLAYMSPEQLNGIRVDGRTDVFALGVILHELVAGERPFAGRSWSELLVSIGSGARVPLTEIPGVPAAVEAIVRRATAVEAKDRFESAADLASALEGSLASGRPEKDAAPAPIPWRLLGLAVLASLGLAAAASVYALRVRPPQVVPVAPVVSATRSVDPVPVVTAARTAATISSEQAVRTRETVATFAESFEIVTVGAHPESLRRSLRMAADALARVRQADDATLAFVLEPLGVAMRKLLVQPRRDDKVAETITLFTDELLGVFPPERMPLIVQVVRAVFVPPTRFNAERAMSRAAELESFARRLDDPLASALTLCAAVECLYVSARSPHALGDVALAERQLALYEAAGVFFAKLSPTERAEMEDHLRHESERLRDIYAFLAREGDPAKRPARVAGAILFAEDAPKHPGGENGNTITMSFRVLLEAAPEDPRTKAFVERYESVLKGEPLYSVYLLEGRRDAKAAAEHACAARAALVARWRFSKDADPPSGRGDFYGDARDFVAAEAQARIALGELDAARALLAELKEWSAHTSASIPTWRLTVSSVEERLAAAAR